MATTRNLCIADVEDNTRRRRRRRRGGRPRTQWKDVPPLPFGSRGRTQPRLGRGGYTLLLLLLLLYCRHRTITATAATGEQWKSGARTRAHDDRGRLPRYRYCGYRLGMCVVCARPTAEGKKKNVQENRFFITRATFRSADDSRSFVRFIEIRTNRLRPSGVVDCVTWCLLVESGT